MSTGRPKELHAFPCRELVVSEGEIDVEAICLLAVCSGFDFWSSVVNSRVDVEASHLIHQQNAFKNTYDTVTHVDW